MRKEEQTAFSGWKEALVSDAILTIYSPYAEAHGCMSKKKLSGIVLQRKANKQLRLVIYKNRQTSNDEQRQPLK